MWGICINYTILLWIYASNTVFHLDLAVECRFMQANFWLGTLLMDRSEDIYRMKGLLSIEGMDERFVFQVISN